MSQHLLRSTVQHTPSPGQRIDSHLSHLPPRNKILENLKGILDVTRSLMCLDQVRLWIQPDLQQRIRERSVSRTPASTFEIGIDDMA